MAEIPIYKSQAAAPSIGSLSIAPVQVPDLHSGDAFGALADFGKAISSYGAFLKNAQDETRTATATTNFITGLDTAETAAANDPNYEQAPAGFNAKAADLEQQTLAAANLDQAARAQLQLKLRALTLSSSGRVQSAALGRTVDAATAARDALGLQLSNKAAGAGSQTERDAAVAAYHDTIDGQVKTGLLHADQAEAAKQRFDAGVAEAELLRTIREKPADAVAALNDPSKFTSLDPARREQFRSAAETALDVAQKDHLLELATGSKPEQASMQMNKGLSRQHEDAIFYNGIINVEHGLPAGGGGPRIASAPAGTKPLAENDPRLAPVYDKSGRRFMVDARFQKNFQGFISDYEAAGGVLGPNTATLGERPNNGSYHPIGDAIDVNQVGWGKRGGGVSLPAATEDALAAKWHLRSGNSFRGDKGPDTGHFDAGGYSGAGFRNSLDLHRAALEVSPAGATGIAQIMPGTAREMAVKAGRPDIAAMSDPQIRDYIVKNPDVGTRFGLMYWHDMLDHYDHNIALAAAAYNAGPAAADKWRDAAFAKFGQDATPLQIASVIPVKETHDYVLKLFGAMGTTPTGSGLSPRAAYSGQAAVDQVVRQQQTAQDQVIKQIASTDRNSTGDDFLDQLKQGHQVSAAAAIMYQHQVNAAAAGDDAAATWARKYETATAALPAVQQAWSMPPAQLANEINRLDAAGAMRPLSHAEIIQADAYKSVQKEIGDNYKTDPVAVAQRAGRFQAAPIDVQAAPNDPAFLSTLADRGHQATDAESVYGVLAPFHPEEVAGLKQRFGQASVDEKLGLLRSMAGTLQPRVYNAAIGQLGLDPHTAIAGQFAPDRPELARKILEGATVRSVPGAEPAVKDLQAQLATDIGGNLFPAGSPANADVITAIADVYLADRGADALFAGSNADAIHTATEEVLGPMAEVGKRKVAAWPAGGASAPTVSQFEALWSGVTDADLAKFGGAFDATGHQVTAADLAAHGQLIQRGPNRSEYFVGFPDASASDGIRLAQTADKKPLVVDFAKLATLAASRPKPPPPPPPAVPGAVTRKPGDAPDNAMPPVEAGRIDPFGVPTPVAPPSPATPAAREMLGPSAGDAFVEPPQPPINPPPPNVPPIQ